MFHQHDLFHTGIGFDLRAGGVDESAESRS